MNGHLDGEAICRWAAGKRSAAAERHLRECAECAAAVGRLESDLAEFRDSAREWSERLRPSPPAWQAHSPAVRWRALFTVAGLAASVTAAALLVAVPLERVRERAAVMRTAAQARADALLLEQVDASVSRSAPAPMEPLLQLVDSTGENQ